MDRAYLIALSRPSTDAERDIATAALDRFTQKWTEQSADSKQSPAVSPEQHAPAEFFSSRM